MANRTVSVGLELHAQQYKSEADGVLVKTREVKDEIKNVDQEVNKIPPDAAKAAAAIGMLGGEAGIARMRLEDLNKPTTLDGLDRRIAQSRDEVRKLSDEFNRTGNGGTLQQLFKADDSVKELEKFRTKLTGMLGDAGRQGGQEMTKDISAAVQGAGSTPGLGPILIGVLVGAAVLAAPMAGAALAGGVVSAIGLGGIGLGIAGQIHDPRVQAAVQQFGRGLKDELANDTSGFAGPIAAGLGEIGAALQRALRGADVGQLAAQVVPLADAIARMVAEAGPGLREAFGAAVPLLQELDRDLPGVGAGLSSFFHELAASNGAVEGLRTLLILVVGFLDMLGHLIGALSNTYDWMLKVGDGASGLGSKILKSLSDSLGLPKFLGDAADKAHELWHELRFGTDTSAVYGRSLADVGDAANLTQDDLKALDGQISATAVTADTLAAHMTQKIFTAVMGVDEATLRWHESLTALDKMLQQNGKQIDKHTDSINLNSKKGQENERAILAVVQANMAQYQAQVAVGMSAADATKQYEANTGALEKQLRQADYTQKEIDGLIGKYKGIPAMVNTTIAIEGLTAAITQLDDLIRMLNGLHSRTIDIVTRQTMVTNINTNMGHPNRWGGLYTHAAEGALRQADVFTPVSPARYAFAEPGTGGEAFVPRFGDYDRSTQILDTAARWYGGRFMPAGAFTGGGTVRHEHVVIVQEPSGRRLAELVISDARNGGTALTSYIRQVASR